MRLYHLAFLSLFFGTTFQASSVLAMQTDEDPGSSPSANKKIRISPASGDTYSVTSASEYKPTDLDISESRETPVSVIKPDPSSLSDKKDPLPNDTKLSSVRDEVLKPNLLDALEILSAQKLYEYEEEGGSLPLLELPISPKEIIKSSGAHAHGKSHDLKAKIKRLIEEEVAKKSSGERNYEIFRMFTGFLWDNHPELAVDLSELLMKSGDEEAWKRILKSLYKTEGYFEEEKLKAKAVELVEKYKDKCPSSLTKKLNNYLLKRSGL